MNQIKQIFVAPFKVRFGSSLFIRPCVATPLRVARIAFQAAGLGNSPAAPSQGNLPVSQKPRPKSVLQYNGTSTVYIYHRQWQRPNVNGRLIETDRFRLRNSSDRSGDVGFSGASQFSLKKLNGGNATPKLSEKQPVDEWVGGKRPKLTQSKRSLRQGLTNGPPTSPVRMGEARVGVEVLSLSLSWPPLLGPGSPRRPRSACPPHAGLLKSAKHPGSMLSGTCERDLLPQDSEVFGPREWRGLLSQSWWWDKALWDGEPPLPVKKRGKPHWSDEYKRTGSGWTSRDDECQGL